MHPCKLKPHTHGLSNALAKWPCWYVSMGQIPSVVRAGVVFSAVRVSATMGVTVVANGVSEILFSFSGVETKPQQREIYRRRRACGTRGLNKREQGGKEESECLTLSLSVTLRLSRPWRRLAALERRTAVYERAGRRAGRRRQIGQVRTWQENRQQAWHLRGRSGGQRCTCRETHRTCPSRCPAAAGQNSCAAFGGAAEKREEGKNRKREEE